MSSDQSDHGTAGIDVAAEHNRAVGLPSGMRFKCEGCGNLTRFDVLVTERANRFWHVSVSGEGSVEESDVKEQLIESVTCRWCGSAEHITTQAAPSAAGEGR